MKPLVFIPLSYKKVDIKQAERLAYEIKSYLVDGYTCKVEQDALGIPDFMAVVINLKDKK